VSSSHTEQGHSSSMDDMCQDFCRRRCSDWSKASANSSAFSVRDSKEREEKKKVIAIDSDSSNQPTPNHPHTSHTKWPRTGAKRRTRRRRERASTQPVSRRRRRRSARATQPPCSTPSRTPHPAPSPSMLTVMLSSMPALSATSRLMLSPSALWFLSPTLCATTRPPRRS
jgi:hypothetical protein